MNKKTFLCTTIASTMILAGITFPMSKAAVEKVVKNSFNVSDAGKAIVIEMSRGAQLQREDIEKIVAERFNKTITKVEGEIGTGAKITLSNNETFTIEIFGDINGDGKVTSSDDEALFNLIGDKKLSSAQQVAGDVSGKKGVQSSDEEALFNRLADKDGKIVDESKWAEYPDNYAASLDYELDARSGETKDTVVKGVEIDKETNTLSVKVVPSTTATPVKVQLVNIPENSVISSTDGIKFADEKPATKRNIEVPSTPGEYSFELKSDNESRTIKVDVLNCTIAKIKSVTEVPNVELTNLNETVANDMKHQGSIWGADPVTSSAGTPKSDLELNLNVNNLHTSTVEGNGNTKAEGKEIAVKVTLDGEYKFYDNDEDLVAFDKNTNTTLPTIASEKGKTYYVYINSNYISSNIILVNSNTTSKQIEDTTQNDDVGIKVNNSGVLGIPNETKKLSLKILEDSTITNKSIKTAVTANQAEVKEGKIGSEIAEPVMDSAVRNTINLYAKTELLKEYEISGNKGKWVGLTVDIVSSGKKATNVTASNISNPESVLVSTDFTTNETIKAKLTSAMKKATTQAIIWIKVPDFSNTNDYMKPYTVDFTYSVDGETTETATFTINIYNAGYVYVKSIEAADDYTKNVIPEGYKISDSDFTAIQKAAGKNSDSTPFKQNITLNTIKLSASERDVVMENGQLTSELSTTPKKPLKLKITYNIPVDKVRFNSGTTVDGNYNTENTVNNDGNNVAGDIYSEYVYFDADSEELTSGLTRTLYNALGLKYNKSYKDNYDKTVNTMDCANYNGTNVTITLKDTSELSTAGVQWQLSGYKSLSGSALTIDRLNNIEPARGKDLSTQLNNAMLPKISDGFTITTTGNLTVNGVTGNWVLGYVQIPQALGDRVTIFDDASSVYADKENASALLGTTSRTEGKVACDVVPVWFNLDKLGLDTTKTDAQNLKTTLKYKLTNSKTNAVEIKPIEVKINCTLASE